MPNVEFWVKIFTEYDETQKVFFDPDYPQVIFSARSIDGKCDGATASNIMLQIRTALKKIVSKKTLDQPYSEEEQKVSRAANLVENYDFSKATVRCQTGRRDVTIEGLSRYQYYKSMIVPILQESNYPEDLQYLPLVESGYDPQAVSGAAAKGLWQFLAETAKRNGLLVNKIKDEREDPYKATIAAIKYLTYLDKLVDDQTCSMQEGGLQISEIWPFALNSYHSGPGRIADAIRCKGPDLAKITKEYEGAGYGFSSSNYVAQFYAKAHIAKNIEKYFDTIETYKPPISILARLKNSIFAKNIASNVDLTVIQLKKFNLGFSNEVWRNKAQIPANSYIEVPFTPENFSNVSNFGADIVRIKNRIEDPIESISFKKVAQLPVHIAEPELKTMSVQFQENSSKQLTKKEQNFFTNLFSKIFKQ